MIDLGFNIRFSDISGVLFQKSSCLHFLLHIFCRSIPLASWTMQVVCVGIDVPPSSPSLVSEPAVLSVARVWLPVLQPYLTAIEIQLVLLKEFVVHLLLVCTFISMRI